MFDSNQKDHQGEFFNDISDMSKKPKKPRFNLARVAVSLSYENIIILSIGLVMLLIVCYSLGVEKGRYLILAEGKDIEDIKVGEEIEAEKGAEKSPEKLAPQPKAKKIKVKVAQVKETSRVFPYIQVATFRTDKYAAKEANKLKNKGYQPFVLSKGKYKEVCVGGYSDKQEASRAQKELKKLYADCLLHSR